jgi:hypothetical protein
VCGTQGRAAAGDASGAAARPRGRYAFICAGSMLPFGPLRVVRFHKSLAHIRWGGLRGVAGGGAVDSGLPHLRGRGLRALTDVVSELAG